MNVDGDTAAVTIVQFGWWSMCNHSSRESTDGVGGARKDQREWLDTGHGVKKCTSGNYVSEADGKLHRTSDIVVKGSSQVYSI